jgi:hypothetical protein
MRSMILGMVLALGCTEAPPIDSGEPLPPKLVWTERVISYDTAPTLVPLPHPEMGFEVWGFFEGREELLNDHYVAVDGLLCERVSLQDEGYYCDTEYWWMLAAYEELTVYSYEE